MSRACLFILVCLLSAFSGVGQSSHVDSLRNIIVNAPDDSTKVNLLIELASNYYRTSPSDAVIIGEQARDLALKIDYKVGIAYAYKTIGIGYYILQNKLETVLNWQESLATFQAIEHKSGIANILANLGSVYFNEGDDEKAIQYYVESLRVAEKINDSLRIVTALINIGAVYAHKEETHLSAKEYYLRALPIAEALINYDAIATATVNLGELYLYDTTDADTNDVLALGYLERALDTYKESASGNVPYALNAIGKVYAKRNDFITAYNYHTQAYELAEASGAVVEMTQALEQIASTKLKQKEFDEAIKFFKRAENLARKDSLRNDLTNILEGIATTYSITNDFEKAYSYRISVDSMNKVNYDVQMATRLQTATLTYDIETRTAEIDKQKLVIQRQKTIRNASLVVGALILLIALGLLNRYTYTRKTNRIIAHEKERSDKLLLNILPEETAEELKNKGSATPKYYKKVSVLFTDFKGFTKIAEKLTPAELVEELNTCFLEFDRIIDKYNIEKIKTIGDAYMCAGGIPVANETNPIDIVHAGLEIKEYMENLKMEREARGEDFWELRIGIHTGPVIAGVVGKNKFAYDIWGDAVNTASRMESSGIPGMVNISGATYELIKENFDCTHRGKIQAKNKGEIDMYIVESVKDQVPHPAEIEV